MVIDYLLIPEVMILVSLMLNQDRIQTQKAGCPFRNGVESETKPKRRIRKQSFWTFFFVSEKRIKCFKESTNHQKH